MIYFNSDYIMLTQNGAMLNRNGVAQLLVFSTSGHVVKAE